MSVSNNNLYKVVNEEVFKFLNEGFGENDELGFRQTLRMRDQRTGSMRIFFSNYNKFSNDYDIDVIDAFVTINWRVKLLTNKMGIEDYNIYGESVEGEFRLEMRDKQTDEVVQETDKNIAEIDWKFIVDEDDEFTKLTISSSLYVQELDFDFGNNTCTLGFRPSEYEEQ